MKWNKVADVKLGNKEFAAVVRTDGFKFFFEKQKDGSYDYPFYEDYLRLYTMINSGSSKINFLDGFDPNKLKVKFKGDKVLPLFLATSIMLSCTSCKDKTVRYTPTSEPTYQTMPIDFTFPGMTLKPLDYFNYAYIIESFDKDKVDFDRIAYPTEFSQICNYELCITSSEAGKYLEKTNVSLFDVKDLINRKDFDSFTKETLNEGLDNLDKSGIKINLDILYYNLTKLEIAYYDELDLPDKSVNESARFVPEKHQVCLNRNTIKNDAYRNILCHEILGHGSTVSYIDEYRAYCSPRLNVAVFDENGNISQLNIFGSSFDEACTEIVASVATGKKIDCYKSGYGFISYVFLNYLSMSGMTINDYLNGGISKFKEKSDRINTDMSYDIINVFDNLLFMQVANMQYSNDYTDLIIQMYMNSINNLEYSGISEDDISKMVNKSLDMFKDYVTPIFEGNGVSYIASYNQAGSEAIINHKDVKECIYYYLDHKDQRGKSI